MAFNENSVRIVEYLREYVGQKILNEQVADALEAYIRGVARHRPLQHE